MAGEGGERFRHFLLEGRSKADQFAREGRGKRLVVPPRDRERHSAELRQQLSSVQADMERVLEAAQDAGEREWVGLQVVFESFPDVGRAFESLERRQSGIELRNLRSQEGKTFATVFVPEGKLDHFERLIGRYLERKIDKKGQPRDHQRLIDAIQEIRTATLRALWTDNENLFPLSDDERIGWEIWLPRSREPAEEIERFSRHAPGMKVVPGRLRFPERTVIVASGTAADLKESVLTLNSIAELRRAKETASFFDEFSSEEQAEWVDELLSRTTFASPGPDVPYVCVLDTGINRGHPLLAPALAAEDLHTVEPGWGVEDAAGHGTEMAGLALFGDLSPALEAAEPVTVGHRLESVKLLRQDGDNAGEPKHHGYLTQEAVARPEVSAPSRKRVHTMAVTAPDGRDRGRPSAWSAAIDALASGVDEAGRGDRRLLVISAGNLNDPQAWSRYPNSNDEEGIHDPAQAWNALTVGAYTELYRIAEEGAEASRPKAPRGGLSPFSTTSDGWDRQWPLKPDVLFEGGNLAEDGLGPVWSPSLSLLTTHGNPTERQFTTMRATSAATALAARLAAQIRAAYPDLWPETVRGLMVHSAEWTDVMKEQFLPPGDAANKADRLRLVRRCGFGVPDLDRALWTLRNSVTLVAEESLQPFRQDESGGSPRLGEMRLYTLPWPRETLLALGAADVELRVTLSYFIEPNPSRRGLVSRYRYESHGLRFDLKRATETEKRFQQRVNAAAKAEAEAPESVELSQGSGDPDWDLGIQGRHRGSIHSDTWRGSAATLADRYAVAVYPTSGWWKLRKGLKAWDRSARYALITTIRSPGVEADLLTEVANQIGVSVEIET